MVIMLVAVILSLDMLHFVLLSVIMLSHCHYTSGGAVIQSVVMLNVAAPFLMHQVLSKAKPDFCFSSQIYPLKILSEIIFH
jgi:hypothetical protein